jgi:hypothetical protein
MRRIIIASIMSLVVVVTGVFLLNSTHTAASDDLRKRAPTATFTPTATATPTATPTPVILHTYTVSATGVAAEAYCDVGDALTGGGLNGNLGGSTVAISIPVVDGATGRSGWHGESFGTGPVTTYAVCLDNPPAHLP